MLLAFAYIINVSQPNAYVVSVREGSSNAAQQIFRVHPVCVDFKGEQAQHDRRSLLRDGSGAGAGWPASGLFL